MIIGIDASNITTGGGITHLKGLLKSFNNSKTEIEQNYCLV